MNVKSNYRALQSAKLVRDMGLRCRRG
jgi:hypothetical protein